MASRSRSARPRLAEAHRPEHALSKLDEVALELGCGGLVVVQGAARWGPRSRCESDGDRRGGGKRCKALQLLAFDGHYRQLPTAQPEPEDDPPRMAHIPYVPRDEASGLLADLYVEYADADGRVDNVLRIHSLNPRSMRDHYRLYAHLMRGPSPLTRTQREILAVVVSAENACFY